MEGGEIYMLIKVWLTVLTSLCYCRTIGTMVPKGTKRLLFLVPVVCLFLFLPLNLSSPHLAGVTAFFIAWLANFKLLLFAFDKGPLSTANVISLPLFVVVACLPIKIQQTQPPKSHQINGLTKQISSRKSKEGALINYAVKCLILAILVRVYDRIEFMHPNFIMLLYTLHIYFILEIILAIGQAMVRSLSSLELEPQFIEPYLSTSLQDFWGKRWNLVVTSILRPTVYEPTLRFSSAVIGRKWAPIPSVFATFFVSGLMHELMFYYLGHCCCIPTGEVVGFFVIHGFCLALEIVLKKALLSSGKCELPGVMTGPLTVGFVLGTGIWLFIPQFSRCKVDVRAFQEYAQLGALLKNSCENILGIFSEKLKVLKAQR